MLESELFEPRAEFVPFEPVLDAVLLFEVPDVERERRCFVVPLVLSAVLSLVPADAPMPIALPDELLLLVPILVAPLELVEPVPTVDPLACPSAGLATKIAAIAAA